MNKVIKLFQITLMGAAFFGLFSPAVFAYSPQITTGNASNITANSATLDGYVNSNLPVSIWFEYSQYSNMTGVSSVSASNNTYSYAYSGNVSTNVYGLRDNTTYYFRMVAENSNGRTVGLIHSFTTSYYNNNNNNYYPTGTNYYYPAGTYNNTNYYYPAGTYSTTTGYNTAGYSAYLNASTESATSVKSTSAELNAMIYNTAGNSSNTWFEWGTNGALGNSTTPVSTGTYPSVKHVNKLSGLAPGTTYFYRAVAENSQSKQVGSVLHFTTSGSKSSTSTNTSTVTNTPSVTKVTNTTSTTNNTTQKSDSLQSQIGASAIGSGSFFPVTILGWLLLFILVLLVVVLTKHALKQPAQKTPDSHGH